ncbi:MAG: MCE family protein, partial [Acetobacteraceae bacterium]|nr:MCE family protein [Acetobacteraceae bacterium]
MGGRGRWRGAALLGLLGCLAATGVAAEQQAQLSLDRLLPGAARERAAAPLPEGGVPFVIRFAGAARGLEPGTVVEINGIRIGAVRSVAL